MGVFEDLHRDRITGSLAMFDRMIFKGRLTALYKQNGAKCFLWTQGVALKDFTPYAKWTTARIADTVRGLVAEAAGGRSSRSIMSRPATTPNAKTIWRSRSPSADGITEGIICVISAVESCMSFQVRKSFKTKTIEMYRRERKCLHHYLYLIDPEFGFMHVRIQGWIPYDCQIYINGREWLARRLGRGGDRLCPLRQRPGEDRQPRGGLRAVRALRPPGVASGAQRLRPACEPDHADGSGRRYGGYYWVLDQAEIATDVMFRTRPRCWRIWPDLVRHAP